MAEATLNEGATDLGASNWSDTTGFANAAQLLISGGTQTISGGLSQTGVSIEYLDIINFSGTIGGASGALTTDVDGTSESATTVVSRLRFWSEGNIWFNAGGGNTLAHYVQQRGGRMYLTGGICKNVHLERGVLNVADAVTATSGIWHLLGGSATADYHASNNIPTVWVAGGGHVFRKQITTLNVLSGSIDIDCKALALTTVNHYGGTLRVVSCGGITNYKGYGGTLDLSNSQRKWTLGSSTNELSPNLNIITNPQVTFGTRSPIGSGPKGIAG